MEKVRERAGGQCTVEGRLAASFQNAAPAGLLQGAACFFLTIVRFNAQGRPFCDRCEIGSGKTMGCGMARRKGVHITLGARGIALRCMPGEKSRTDGDGFSLVNPAQPFAPNAVMALLVLVKKRQG